MGEVEGPEEDAAFQTHAAAGIDHRFGRGQHSIATGRYRQRLGKDILRLLYARNGKQIGNTGLYLG